MASLPLCDPQHGGFRVVNSHVGPKWLETMAFPRAALQVKGVASALVS